MEINKNMKKLVVPALLCAATISTLSITSGKRGVQASQLKSGQQSRQSISWDNSKPVQETVNNNPQSKLTFKNKNNQNSNSEQVNKNDSYAQKLNNDFHISNNNKRRYINNNTSLRHSHKHINQFIRKHHSSTKRMVVVNNNRRKHYRNHKIFRHHRRNHNIRRNNTLNTIKHIRKHHHRKINTPADADIPQQNINNKNNAKNTFKISIHNNVKKNKQQQTMPQVHDIHYYMHKKWFTDGLSKRQLRARAWIVHRESRGIWNILSYGHVCIGRFQLSPSLLGRKHGHINLNKHHQVKVADEYVVNRYGSWVKAQHFWASHHWY